MSSFKKKKSDGPVRYRPSEKGRASPADLFIAQEEAKTFSGAGNLLIILGILSELENYKPGGRGNRRRVQQQG